jgi:3-oxoacyl-[acyl-carrier protein] reductase
MAGILEKAFSSRGGRDVAGRLGLPEPPVLRRGRELPRGPLVLASLAGSSLAGRTADLLGLPTRPALHDDGAEPPRYSESIGAIVVDACGLRRIDELESLRAVLRPAVRGLEPSGRVVILADAEVEGLEANAVRQALDGITRTIGKELRGGATANLVQIASGVGPADLSSTLGFLLEGRSAFVDGQSWTVAATGSRAVPDPAPGGTGVGELAGSPPPLANRIVVVTGAARGIGAQIATVAARDGAAVVCVDVPAAGESLARLANELRGTALQLDITLADAGARIAEHVASRHGEHARIHGIVHNAGITRDKLLVNTDAVRWAQVLQVNLAAELRINPVLLDGRPGGLAEQGRIVGIASTSGIAGNRGQANYAASKAGVVGLVRALAPELAPRGITVNAVAPGFIETDMTAKIPFVQREVFRRTNSLGQGGLPVDVAETIGYFLDPASSGVTGQVIRVCGQNLVGQ